MSLTDQKLAPGQGVVHLERAFGSSGRPSFRELAFCYPLKLMPPRISSSGAELGNTVACLYMLTYGGGLVAGDKVDLAVNVDEGCHLVLLTQGNTKVFKDRPGGSYKPATDGWQQEDTSTRQRMRVNIRPNASLFLLPAPVTCFKSASYLQHQTFHLLDPDSSSLILLDWFTSGRQARGEHWQFDRHRSRNEVVVGEQQSGQRIINDVLLLEGSDIASRMAHYACYCNLFICGSPVQSLSQHFKQLSHDTTQYTSSQPESVIWSFSELKSDYAAVVRCAGVDTEIIREWLATNLLPLQALIGRDAYKAAFV